MKKSKKGISLIVLIITIIVIVILATAILVSVISNNPISEANKARYESDRDNMQAVFTNTVGKIMAENQGVVNVTAGQINTETTGVNETTGEVAYTVDNATVAANASGTIKFDKGTNDATTYYIGKKLPIYAAGETKWYVDSEGVLSLEVAGVKYGSGEVALTYISLGNYEHEASNGTIEAHDTENGICSKCGENVLPIGIAYENGTFKTWDELINEGLVTETSIGSTAFIGRTDLVSITLPNTITNIGNNAFRSCNNLTTIIIPDSVTNIGDGAFAGTDLTTITIPEGVTTINVEVFDSCRFNSVIIPNSVTEIKSSAFNACTNLTSITIPDSVTSIGSNAFSCCTNLTSIELPNSITSLGRFTFFACENLTTITIPNSVSALGYKIFSSCHNLTSVTMSNNITYFDGQCFSNCKNLTTINFIGTKEEFNNINKFDDIAGEYWNIGCPEITVHCTDGDIVIPANQ